MGLAINIKQFFDALALKANASTLTSHTGNTSNPHSVTASQVGAYTSGAVDGLLAGKANSSHTHTKSAITDFPTTWPWASLTGVPSTFPPESHTQAISTITGLQDELSGLEDVDGTKLPLGGGEMSGNIEMFDNSILFAGGLLDMGAGSIEGVSAAFINALTITDVGSITFDGEGEINLNSNPINNVSTIGIIDTGSINFAGEGEINFSAFGTGAINMFGNNINFAGGNINGINAIYFEYEGVGSNGISQSDANTLYFNSHDISGLNSLYMNGDINISGMITMDGNGIEMGGGDIFGVGQIYTNYINSNGNSEITFATPVEMNGSNFYMGAGSGSGGGTLYMDSGNIEVGNASIFIGSGSLEFGDVGSIHFNYNSTSNLLNMNSGIIDNAAQINISAPDGWTAFSASDYLGNYIRMFESSGGPFFTIFKNSDSTFMRVNTDLRWYGDSPIYGSGHVVVEATFDVDNTIFAQQYNIRESGGTTHDGYTGNVSVGNDTQDGSVVLEIVGGIIVGIS